MHIHINCKIIKLETLQSFAGRRTAVLYAECGRNSLIKCRSRSAKKQRLQRLPHVCHSVTPERSSSSRWRTGTRKPKSKHAQVYPQKTPKNDFLWDKWSLFRKISEFCSKSIHDDTDSRFVFTFREIVCREVDETMRCFGDKKFTICSFFSAILRPFGRGRLCREAYHVTLRLPVKFRLNRFQFASVIPEKVNCTIIYIQFYTFHVIQMRNGNGVRVKKVKMQCSVYIIRQVVAHFRVPLSRRH